MSWLKNLYNWVLEWSDSKWGTLALFLIAFAEASFFPIPPDVLLIALCLGLRSKALKFALICTIGSVFGSIFGYSIGYFFWSNTSVSTFFFDIVP